MEMLKDASLRAYNTFGVNAQARYLARVETVTEIQEVLNDRNFANYPRLILGGGSNLLFTQSFDGLVIKLNIFGRKIVSENEDIAVVEAGAGENWHELVQWTVSQKLGGLENLSLIPGNVGASPMQNIGAYGVEIKNCFHSLDALELRTGALRTFDAEECAFGYRESVFKKELKNMYAIVRVRYALSKKPVFNTSYGAIAQELERMNITSLSLEAISQAVINIRRSKLPDPNVLGNAGSFFKNPVVSAEEFRFLVAKYPEIPNYPAPDNTVKLAAGWLIEKCGWKGKRMGNCGMHEKQALVLVNYGDATGSELYDHSEKVLQSVKEKFGITLEREVNII